MEGSRWVECSMTVSRTRPMEMERTGRGLFISMKPPRSFREQLSLMESRGLTVEDEPSALRRLAESNYYRLRGYWLTFEEDGRFIPGTTFDDI